MIEKENENQEETKDTEDVSTEDALNNEETIDASEFTPIAGKNANANEDNQEPVTVQSVEFPSFDTAAQTSGEENKNLDLLMDIKLQLSVELGRAELPVKKVLELTRGSIVELDKIAGEPVELYANGKLVAFGEVVVIEDNFGLRITSIYEPEDRLKNL
jgi:flagellar motor switch protein FliN